MSIAIFQCLGDGRIKKLATHLQADKNFRGCSFTQMSTILCVSFSGDCGQMYKRCMAVAEEFVEEVAFIGVDESSKYPADYYSLDALGQMARLVEYRTVKQDSCYNVLKYEFKKAIRGSHFTYEDFVNIISHCYLGIDIVNSGVGYVANLFESMANVDMSDEDMEQLIEDETACELSAVGHWTIIRVMAHVCYLCLSRFKKKGGVSVGYCAVPVR